MMAKSIIEMHCAAANHCKTIGDAFFHKKLCDIIR